MSNITVYHKDYCPYCKAAKSLLKAKGLPFTEIEVTDNAKEFSNMIKRSERKTVPQIFVGDIHIGGFDDLQALIQTHAFPFHLVDAA